MKDKLKFIPKFFYLFLLVISCKMCVFGKNITNIELKQVFCMIDHAKCISLKLTSFQIS